MAFRYAAAYATLSAVGMFPGLGANAWDILAYTAGIAITLAGTIYCYQMNGGSRGQHFLDRYFSLGLVAVIRLLPAFILIAFGVIIAQEILGDVPADTTAVEAAIGMLFMAAVYWRIGSHIRSVSQQGLEPQGT